MADADKGEEKKGSLTGQIVASVAVALLVGGTSPWWVNSFFKKTPQNPVQATVSQPATSSQPPVAASATEPTLEPSADFFVGRWRVDQEIGSLSGGNVVDYYRDGRFQGKDIEVMGGEGRTILELGRWEVEKLSARTFRLTLNFANGTQWAGQFKILDRNHIQNIDQNYVAERVE